MQIYDDGSYLRHNPTWHEEDAPWKASLIHELMASRNLSAQRICEVGCGSGAVLAELQRLSLRSEASYVGYDISQTAIELAMGKSDSNLRFELGDALAQPAGSYDLALAIDVVEHVDDYLGFLAGVRDLADWKILHLPLEISVSAIVRAEPLLRSRTTAGHIHYFTKETALASIEAAGMFIEHSQLTHAALGGGAPATTPDLRRRVAVWPRKAAALVSESWAARLVGGYSVLVLAR